MTIHFLHQLAVSTFGLRLCHLIAPAQFVGASFVSLWPLRKPELPFPTSDDERTFPVAVPGLSHFASCQDR
jgi:hypothetical protein